MRAARMPSPQVHPGRDQLGQRHNRLADNGQARATRSIWLQDHHLPRRERRDEPEPPLPPPQPEGWIEYGIGTRRIPERLHTGDCAVTCRGQVATAQSVRETG